MDNYTKIIKKDEEYLVVHMNYVYFKHKDKDIVKRAFNEIKNGVDFINIKPYPFDNNSSIKNPYVAEACVKKLNKEYKGVFFNNDLILKHKHDLKKLLRLCWFINKDKYKAQIICKHLKEENKPLSYLYGHLVNPRYNKEISKRRYKNKVYRRTRYNIIYNDEIIYKTYNKDKADYIVDFIIDNEKIFKKLNTKKQVKEALDEHLKRINSFK